MIELVPSHISKNLLFKRHVILVNWSVSEPIKVRQMHERDLAIKEASLIKDNLNVEISTLRQELQLSLEEVRNLGNQDLVTKKIVVRTKISGKT